MSDELIKKTITFNYAGDETFSLEYDKEQAIVIAQHILELHYHKAFIEVFTKEELIMFLEERDIPVTEKNISDMACFMSMEDYWGLIEDSAESNIKDHEWENNDKSKAV